MRLNSLAARLIAAAAIWTMLGLAVGGVVLSGAFRSAVLNNFDARLSGDMDGLIAAAQPDDDGGVVLQDRFVNHAFDRVYSGLYYEIKPVVAGQAGGQISHSLFDHGITPTSEVKNGVITYGYAAGPENQALRVLSRRVEFPIAATPDQNDSRAYTFMVAGDLAAVDAESSAFNGTLIWSFVVLGLGLVVAILLQVRIGLLPLRRLKDALHRIRDGKAQRLEGNFPAEIAPLAEELNSLIEHSAEIVARARTHVSNLAHFLKTPLSVLASEADATQKESGEGTLSDQVRRQVDVMRRQVDHYLARARRRQRQCAGQSHPGSAGAAGPCPGADAHSRRARHRHRCRLPACNLFPRRAPGSGRDGGQSDGQCRQMGQKPGAGARGSGRRPLCPDGGR